MSNASDLGLFELGQAVLGTAKQQTTGADTITIGETQTISTISNITDYIDISETLLQKIKTFTEDFINLLESGFYPTDGMAGIIGKVVLRLNVEATDFCAMVEESGMSIAINGVPSRAFTFIKQRGQSFDINTKIFPGDAVMFSCPEDDILLKIGDIIQFDMYNFQVIAIINHYFDGNIIYRKSALQRIRSIPTLPTVTGVLLSENVNGKVTLTWDNISTGQFPWLDHYEIWAGYGIQSFQMQEINIANNQIMIEGDATTWIKNDNTFEITGNPDKNGTYTATTVSFSSTLNKTTITIGAIGAPPIFTTNNTEGTLWITNLDSALVETNILAINQIEYGNATMKLAINHCPSIWKDYAGGNIIPVTIEKNTNNYGDYLVNEQIQDDANQVVRIPNNFSTAEPFGTMKNMKNYNNIKTSNVPNATVSNISTGRDTFFMVRAVDIYNKPGPFSIELRSSTPTQPTEVEGLR